MSVSVSMSATMPDNRTFHVLEAVPERKLPPEAALSNEGHR